MNNKIIKKNLSSSCSLKEVKDKMLEMLIFNEQCISFNKNMNIPIWNYMLNEDKTKLFVFDEEDKTIYDDLVIQAPDFIFEHGDYFAVVDFKGIDIEENIVNRKNFYILENINSYLKENI